MSKMFREIEEDALKDMDERMDEFVEDCAASYAKKLDDVLKQDGLNIFVTQEILDDCVIPVSKDFKGSLIGDCSNTKTDKEDAG